MFNSNLLNKKFDHKVVNIMDKMVRELGIYMNIFEVDKCMEFMRTIEDSKYDVNPTVTDCATQLKLILGSDRYHEIVLQWSMNNQKKLSVFGTLKYKEKKTGKIWDGLDPTDKIEDYEKVYL